jgi:hypothetical protein
MKRRGFLGSLISLIPISVMADKVIKEDCVKLRPAIEKLTDTNLQYRTYMTTSAVTCCTFVTKDWGY